ELVLPQFRPQHDGALLLVRGLRARRLQLGPVDGRGLRCGHRRPRRGARRGRGASGLRQSPRAARGQPALALHRPRPEPARHDAAGARLRQPEILVRRPHLRGFAPTRGAGAAARPCRLPRTTTGQEAKGQDL
ncbi:MAG: Dipeptide-binding ABC transporter, periplasmic substrate-binding component, partial [uncultured Acetobacteraceae bacterium]